MNIEFSVILILHKKILYNGLAVVIYPNPLIKDNHMDKFTRKTSFEQWFSPIAQQLFEKRVKNPSIKLLYKEATHGFIYEITVIRARLSSKNNIILCLPI